MRPARARPRTNPEATEARSVPPVARRMRTESHPTATMAEARAARTAERAPMSPPTATPPARRRLGPGHSHHGPPRGDVDGSDGDEVARGGGAIRPMAVPIEAYIEGDPRVAGDAAPVEGRSRAPCSEPGKSRSDPTASRHGRTECGAVRPARASSRTDGPPHGRKVTAVTRCGGGARRDGESCEAARDPVGREEESSGCRSGETVRVGRACMEVDAGAA
jgi:hypothetical protein